MEILRVGTMGAKRLSSGGKPVIMDVDNSEDSQDNLPWMNCVMGCKVDTSRSVVLLGCLHAICSDECLLKFKSGLNVKSGNAIGCGLCQFLITPAQLENRIIPKDIFLKKTDHAEVELICENCVLDRPSVAFCDDCPALLCQQCKELHPQTRSTQKHKINPDLTEHKEKQAEIMKEKEKRCNQHVEELLNNYCVTCTSKICDKCMNGHNDHVVLQIAKEKGKTKEKIETAKKLVDKCEQVVGEILVKRNEILNSEWNSVMADINNGFAQMISALMRRHNALKREAKFKFMKKLAALNVKVKGAESYKAYCERLVKTMEDVVSNRDEIAAIKFATVSKSCMERFGEMEKKFTNEFDRFVEKDWHFQVDKAANFQLQKYLNEYCQVDYSYKPAPAVSARVPLKTYGGIKKNGNNPETLKPATNVQNSTPERFTNKYGPLKTGIHPKSPSRRIAVKSTSASQLSVNKLKAETVRLHAIKSEMGFLTNKESIPESKSKIHIQKNQLFDMEEVETENEDESLASTRMDEDETDEFLDVDNVDETEPTCQIAEVSNYDDTEAVTGLAGEDGFSKMNGNPILDESNEMQVLSVPIAEAEEEKENSEDNEKESIGPVSESSKMDVQHKVDEPEKSSVLNEISQVEDASVEAAHSTKVRPSIASPESITSLSTQSESPELGIGKRERKKKSFPEFLDTDETLKYYKNMRNRSGPAAKVPRKSDTPTESTGKVKVENENDRKFDYESSDDWTPDQKPGSSDRRQSLRKKGHEQNAETGTTQSGRRGRPRRKGCVQDGFIHEAPISSIEEPPELSDYPIQQGQLNMKITNVDENEDYCAICLDGGDEIIVCCDFCPKVFHMRCHLPILKEIPAGTQTWQCNYDTTKEVVEKKFCEEECSESRELVDTNKRLFELACKFVMECYKIPQIPTMRWIFPRGYLEAFDRVPFHLKYIRERLALGEPEPFASVEDMLLAFKQMFVQAFQYYKRIKKHLEAVHTCYRNFIVLVEEYYPHHRDLFNDVSLC